MKDDTISRAAAIDAVNNMIRRKFGISADLGTGALLELPSATDTNVGGNLIDRQAAVELIERMKPYHQDADDIAEMIANMPSAQPGCEDTVYRKAVQMLLAYFVPEERYAEAVDGLRGLPSAQPERKTGKWVKYDGDWFKTMFKCSECGAMIDINEKYRNFFCYHCGARMDGEQDG